MKKCVNCKIEKELSEFSIDKGRKDGLKSHCKTCVNKHGAVYIRTTVGKYTRLKSSAKERNLEMQISFEQYAEIIKESKCYYCDASLVGSAGHSLNRIDSNKGYLVENVNPCCGFCNQIMSNYSIKELSNRVYKIIARMKKLQKENK